METNTILKYKKYSTSQLRKIATRYFNKYIRERDADEYGYARCISSGQIIKLGTSNYHAGHYISKGSCPALEFNEDNVHAQGKSDNYFKSGNLVQYRINLINKIGIERVEEIERLAVMYKRTAFKHDRFRLIEIIEKYKKKS